MRESATSGKVCGRGGGFFCVKLQRHAFECCFCVEKFWDGEG